MSSSPVYCQQDVMVVFIFTIVAHTISLSVSTSLATLAFVVFNTRNH